MAEQDLPALSDARILHAWDTQVGEPTAALPLVDADKLQFARAIEAAATATLRADLDASRTKCALLAAEVEGLRKDAERYRWIRAGTQGLRCGHDGEQEFGYPYPTPIGNIMRGSVAQHLDKAIDAALSSAAAAPNLGEAG